jgi:hypothetical protein
VSAFAVAACGAPDAPQTPHSPGETRGAAATAATGATAGGAIAWDYDVTVEPSLDLDVRATFHAPISGALRIDDEAVKSVEHLELQDGNTWKTIALGDRHWSERCTALCTVRYKFKLRDVATAAHDLDVALVAGGAIFASPSTWLVRPSDVPSARYRFHVTTPPPPSRIAFATGVRAAPALAGSYEADASSLEESAFAAFGALRLGHVADPGIEHAIAPDVALPDDVVVRWVRAEVSAISSYFGHAPDNQAMIFVAPGSGKNTSGKTIGGGGASLVVTLADKISERELMDDWVVAHELIHVTFPDVGRRYTWFSEGLATYIEPIARERAGLIARERVWSDMLEGLPQGLPGPQDGGLDGTRDWGRTYWGGALYFFLADVRIREKTRGAKSLQDALRAVVATGANVEAMLPLDRILAIGDSATGTKVMRETYDEIGTKRGDIDLVALMQRLGVHAEVGKPGTVRFDDAAPLAAVRDAILPKK